MTFISWKVFSCVHQILITNLQRNVLNQEGRIIISNQILGCRGWTDWSRNVVFLLQDEGDAADREELAAGDWISVSVEMERWNSLICQLTDLQALASFIKRLTVNNQKSKQAVDNSGSPNLSVVGKSW